jgi:hypothetical protein
VLSVGRAWTFGLAILAVRAYRLEESRRLA